jgi:hypothetical protein
MRNGERERESKKSYVRKKGRESVCLRGKGYLSSNVLAARVEIMGEKHLIFFFSIFCLAFNSQCPVL